MSFTISKTEKLSKIVWVDLVLLGIICLVPALSHLFALPLYKMNPMLLCLMAGMLLVRDRRNAYLLAVILPLCSMMATGMPVPLKAACMVLEMLTVVAVAQLLERKAPVFVTMFVAVLAGKVVYYSMKAILIAPVLLVETSLWMQLAVAVLYTGVYAILVQRR